MMSKWSIAEPTQTVRWPKAHRPAQPTLLWPRASSIRTLEQMFGLSEAEKQTLVASNIGEGLFFAGKQHVAVRILASPSEKEFITTNVV